MTVEAPILSHRYEAKFCLLMAKHVWAIRTRQSSGGWRIVNCLDKQHHCAAAGCAFAGDAGVWPFERRCPFSPEHTNGSNPS